MSESTQANRLQHETSPYLLQHAHNPVDWYPWGTEALAKAQQEDKPIIVSIGYSACHWCHVMEKECFEETEVARLMNEHFVSIKIDREERPDVDQIYMEAVQSMGVQGGWPLNVFLMPDQKPFYGGTYFPKPNWMALLKNVADAFAQSRQALAESAQQFAEHLSLSEVLKYDLLAVSDTLSGDDLADQLPAIYAKFSASFDREKGGMQHAPKFPMPVHWLFLLRYHAHTQDPAALEQVTLTLDHMADGGIYDQLGGGFARYSVDAEWFAPHFEKMLYDNGQLLSLYAEAFTLTKNPAYRQVIQDTAVFVRREMTSGEGGFYSALDADSEGEEGKFYVWRYEELKELLGENYKLIADYYGITKAGNWENGENILHKPLSDEAFASKHYLDEEELHKLVGQAKEMLFNARTGRIRPGLDDKILTAWNGLMLKGLADTYAALDNDTLLTMAAQNAHFIAEKLTRTEAGQTGLYRTYKNGKASLDAYLEDYACVVDGLVALYQVSFEERWLSLAESLTEYTMAHFLDTEEGFFFFTDDASALIARKKELFDNVMPASNATMAHNLHKLGLLLDRPAYTAQAEKMLNQMMKLLTQEPAYLSHWASLATEMAHPAAEIAIVGPEVQAYRTSLQQHYYPFKVLTGTATQSDLPLLQQREAIQGKTTLYVCYNKTCQLPVHDPEKAFQQLV